MSDVHHHHHHDSAGGGSEAGFSLSSFSFKLQDRRGRMHRFSCGNLSLLLACMQLHQSLTYADGELVTSPSSLPAEVQSLTPLVTCILRRLGADIDPDRLPQILVHIHTCSCIYIPDWPSADKEILL
jgi:hypothetical protein